MLAISATQRFFNAFLAISLFVLSGMTSSYAAEFVAGKDYKELEIQDKVDGNNIIVREFFWYGCPHCYKLEPYVQAWEKTKADDVIFVRTPSPFNSVWEANARGYYAAQELGIADTTHTALLHAIHQKNQHLYSKDSLAKFYAGFGANEKAFKKHYSSAKVSKKIQMARDAARRYQLSGVPAIIVNGRYVVGGNNAKTFQVVDYLIDKIKKERN